MTLTLNLNRLEPSVNTSMDIIDIYRGKLNENNINSNIVLSGNEITISIDDKYNKELVDTCLEEAGKDAVMYAMLVCSYDISNGLPIVEIEG